MATNFGYVERTADSYVNWAEVSKSMTDNLYEIEKQRNDKKKALDTAAQESLSFIKNIPLGEDRDANQAALDHAGAAEKMLLDAQRKMKSGLMTPTEFMKFRESLHSGTKDGYTALKEYQEFYADRMKRWKDGASSSLEIKNLAHVEGFGDFTKSGFYINPYTGNVLMAKKEAKNVDGQDVYVMSNNPNEVQSVKGILNMIRTKYDKYDYAKDLAEFVKQNGADIRVTAAAGFNRSVEDITQKRYKNIDEAYKDATKLKSDLEAKIKTAKGDDKKKAQDDLKKVNSSLADYDKNNLYKYQDWESKYMNSFLAPPQNTMSVLLDNNIVSSKNGKTYDITYDESEAKSNPNLILVKTDSAGRQTFEFSDEQKKDALDFMTANARRMYTYKETQAQLSYEKESDESKGNRKAQESLATNWATVLMSDDEGAKQSSLDAILRSEEARKLGIVEISVNENEFIVKKQNQDGTTFISDTIPLKKGADPYTLFNAIKTGDIFGLQGEASIALKRAGGYSGSGSKKIGGFNGKTFTSKSNITYSGGQQPTQGTQGGSNYVPYSLTPGLQGNNTGASFNDQ
jgi:hypothetical protein